MFRSLVLKWVCMILLIIGLVVLIIVWVLGIVVVSSGMFSFFSLGVLFMV